MGILKVTESGTAMDNPFSISRLPANETKIFLCEDMGPHGIMPIILNTVNKAEVTLALSEVNILTQPN